MRTCHENSYHSKEFYYNDYHGKTCVIKTSWLYNLVANNLNKQAEMIIQMGDQGHCGAKADNKITIYISSCMIEKAHFQILL